MIMFIRAPICGLNGAGSASAARGSSASGCGAGCCATILAGQVAIARMASSAGSDIKGKVFRMNSVLYLALPFVELAVRLYTHRPDDGADQQQHDQPMAAIDPY